MGVQLLVIGNGFDRWCGLPSSFNQFLNSRIKDNEAFFNDFSHLINDKRINPKSFRTLLKNHKDFVKDGFLIWDLIFYMYSDYMNKEILWCDVEKTIYDILNDKFSRLDDEIVNFWDHLEDKLINGNDYHAIDSMISISDKTILSVYVNEYLIINRDKYPKYYKGFIYLILYRHLRLFEESFSIYLNDKLKGNNDYDGKKWSLLNAFTNASYNFDQTFVLSFNYTNIGISSKITRVENVHGTLKANNCIIGIDNTSIEYSNPAYRFTKTYRKAEYFTRNTGKRIQNVITKNISQISFFGHSLNYQDRAYFQSIFDICNIYDNDNLKVTFFYSIPDNQNEDEYKTNVISKVVGLIEDYGRTFVTNPAQGKNLLHKLLISSRLRIKEIPKTVDDLLIQNDFFV